VNNILGHTAVKIAPQYRETIHVNDARAVTVAGSLLNKDKKYTQVILEQEYDAFKRFLNRSRDKRTL
jgi:5-methyltetrahydrofolate--homocysteine methyltransferase